jgi:hypothetical protein
MLRILILICSSQVSPQDCQRETALDLISGPQVNSVFSCAMQGQAVLASTANIGRRPNEYVKIGCEHLEGPDTSQQL